MSDTPRTDAATKGGEVLYVNVEFARQLERELNEANRKLQWQVEATTRYEKKAAIFTDAIGCDVCRVTVPQTQITLSPAGVNRLCSKCASREGAD